MNTTPALSLRNIHKSFDGIVAVEDLSLDVKRGEIVALVFEVLAATDVEECRERHTHLSGAVGQHHRHEGHHRDGVPLDVYYPPGHAVPIVLPQILTPSVVRRALRDEVE